MDMVRHETVGRLHQLQTLEHGLVCRVAEEVGNRALVSILRAASRLGDWPLSVAVGLMLLAGPGLRAMLIWTAASVSAVIIQCALKKLCARTRPCERPDGPPQRAPIPDKGSFPSGHTLHAIMGLVTVAHLLPVLTPVFAVIALLVATSRVVLGVHYPSDVVAGACMGLLFGLAASMVL
jgi:undecaprenyl-diphosphatase